MRGACFLGLMLALLGLPSCGKKKPPALTTVAAPKPPPDPNQEAGERVQREVALGYLIAGIPSVEALLGEDLDGDGAADLGRLTFDTQLRLQQLILVRQLGIGFGREYLKAEQARRFTGADGRVNTVMHQAFLEKTLPNSGLTVADWDRFVNLPTSRMAADRSKVRDTNTNPGVFSGEKTDTQRRSRCNVLTVGLKNYRQKCHIRRRKLGTNSPASAQRVAATAIRTNGIPPSCWTMSSTS